MLTVPLAGAGGFIGLKLMNIFITPQPMDVLTMLGFVILIGVVVNNSILIVHQALNNFHDNGEKCPHMGRTSFTVVTRYFFGRGKKYARQQRTVLALVEKTFHSSGDKVPRSWRKTSTTMAISVCPMR